MRGDFLGLQLIATLCFAAFIPLSAIFAEKFGRKIPRLLSAYFQHCSDYALRHYRFRQPNTGVPVPLYWPFHHGTDLWPDWHGTF